MALWKNGKVIDDLWRPMPEDGPVPNGVPTILPLKAWMRVGSQRPWCWGPWAP